jgi:hypothetical protein
MNNQEKLFIVKQANAARKALALMTRPAMVRGGQGWKTSGPRFIQDLMKRQKGIKDFSPADQEKLIRALSNDDPFMPQKWHESLPEYHEGIRTLKRLLNG